MALAKAGLQVEVISPRRISLREILKNRRPLTTIPQLKESQYPYIGIPRISWLDEAVWKKVTHRLYSEYISRHGPPDILHAHSLFPAGMLAAELPARARILTEHLSTFLGSQGARLASRAASKISGFATRIAVGPSLAGTMEQLIVSGGPWICVPNLVDMKFFSPTCPPSFPVRVLTVSNLTPNKRVDWVIRAFDRSFGDTNAELCIVGDGSERGDLQRLASRLGSASRIRFLGAQSRAQVRDELDQCTIFALASRHEPFGVVLIEAMAMGRPVIATRSGGPASIVTNKAGILVDVDNFNGFADGMLALVSNLSAYDHDSIRAYCDTRFSERAVTSQLIDVYASALRSD